MKLIGYKKAKDFTAPDSGVTYSGWNLFFTYPIEPTATQEGFGCMSVNFVKDSVFQAFLKECKDYSISPLGVSVECYYSRYSKPGKPKIDLIRIDSEFIDKLADKR